MKPIVAAGLIVAVGMPAFSTTRTANPCGAPTRGIAICLATTATPDIVSLEITNDDSADAVIDAGVMLANGARQYPSAVRLIARDSRGHELVGTPIDPAIVAGRLDPLVVPLPAGASVRMPLRLSRYLFRGTGDSSGTGLGRGGRFVVRARLTGLGPDASHLNLDVKGLALMPYWRGTIESNAISVVPAAAPE